MKIIKEISGDAVLEELKNGHHVIAYSTQRMRDELLTKVRTLSLRACVLKDPALYLSPKKLNEKLQAAHFSAEETPFLLKMIVWNDATKTGDREEISLEREEYGLFENLCDEEGTDEYFTRAFEEAQTSDCILIHHSGLAHGLFRRAFENTKASENLIIAEAAHLEDSLTNAFRKKFTESRLRPVFGEKAALLFGLLGIFFEKLSARDEYGYRGNVMVDETARASMEWQRFCAAAENLAACRQKKELMEILAPPIAAPTETPAETPQSNPPIIWVSSYLDEISLNTAPIKLPPIFQQAVENFKNVTLADETLTVGNSFQFLRELFGLDSDWTEMPAAQPHNTLIIPEKFPEPYASGYFKRCEKLFLELIAEKKGGCLFLMSSKKAATAMFQSMLPKMPKETRLLAIGSTGGIGKTTALFLENPQRAALLVTAQILPHLAEIEEHIKVVVFQKIPFDPPDDPVLSARAKFFKNAFEDYTVPRAVLRWRGLLKELNRGPREKICYLLDSRLQTKKYGAFFLQRI